MMGDSSLLSNEELAEKTKASTWKWLESTEKLQIESYGNDLRNVSGEDQDRALINNHAGLVWELTEAMDETSAKPWSAETGRINREKYLGELVDAAHFLANLILIGDFTEEEFWEAYRAKQERNRARMARPQGYKASENRCDGCKRELDRPGAYSLVSQELQHVTVNGQGVEKIKYVIKCRCDHKTTLVLSLEEKLP